MSTSNGIKKVFLAYTNGKETMDSGTYVKVFKELGILNKRVNAADLEIIYAKVRGAKGNKIDYNTFFSSLGYVAEKKGVDTTCIVDKMTSSTLPCYDGKATKATPPKDGFCHDAVGHASHSHLPAVGTKVEVVHVPVPTPVVSHCSTPVISPCPTSYSATAHCPPAAAYCPPVYNVHSVNSSHLSHHSTVFNKDSHLDIVVPSHHTSVTSHKDIVVPTPNYNTYDTIVATARDN